MSITIDCGEGRHDACSGAGTDPYLIPQRSGQRFKCRCRCHPRDQQWFIDAITNERERQEAKFPEQHLPNTQRPYQPRFIASAEQARRWVDKSADHDSLSWTDVLVEEVCEAIDAAEDDDLRGLSTELIQIAAVCVRWLEDIGRAR